MMELKYLRINKELTARIHNEKEKRKTKYGEILKKKNPVRHRKWKRDGRSHERERVIGANH